MQTGNSKTRTEQTALPHDLVQLYASQPYNDHVPLPGIRAAPNKVLDFAVGAFFSRVKKPKRKGHWTILPFYPTKDDLLPTTGREGHPGENPSKTTTKQKYGGGGGEDLLLVTSTKATKGADPCHTLFSLVRESQRGLAEHPETIKINDESPMFVTTCEKSPRAA